MSQFYLPKQESEFVKNAPDKETSDYTLTVTPEQNNLYVHVECHSCQEKDASIAELEAALAERDAELERLKWMLEETWGQGGMEYGPPDFSEYVAELERSWEER